MPLNTVFASGPTEFFCVEVPMEIYYSEPRLLSKFNPDNFSKFPKSKADAYIVHLLPDFWKSNSNFN
jgi:hypothetical protein